MRVHITDLFGMTQMIARHRTAEVGMSLGFALMGIYYYCVDHDTDSELSKRIDGIIAAVEPGDVVIIQYPTLNGTRFERTLIQKLKSYPETKVIIFDHDIEPMMATAGVKGVPRSQVEEIVETFNMTDLIVIASEEMRNELNSYGLKVQKVLYQEIFDYPCKMATVKPQFFRQLLFTGNQYRFHFVSDWKYTTPLVLYSSYEFTEKGCNVEWRGYKEDTELLYDMSKGGLGLIFADPYHYDYYQLCKPYKLGTFLAAGIPVVVQEGIAIQKFVEDNHIGVVASSLQEASDIVQNMTEAEYMTLVENVRRMSFLVREGYFTKRVLLDAVDSVLRN